MVVDFRRLLDIRPQVLIPAAGDENRFPPVFWPWNGALHHPSILRQPGVLLNPLFFSCSEVKLRMPQPIWLYFTVLAAKCTSITQGIAQGSLALF